MKRFVILGLPRSGSTYLMTLLNAHRDMVCSGEQFNPYGVIGVNERDDSHEAVLGRDKDPVGHMTAFFEREQAQNVTCAGFKYMIGHNIKILHELARDPDVTIIHIWRDNRLAQVSSLIKAIRSKNWAQTRSNEHIEQKIHVTPRDISHRWHEYATFDHLIGMWLKTLPNAHISYEYRDLFKPDFEQGICAYLGVPYTPSMQSPLVKQSHNAILDRFEDPNPIRYYFTQVGYAHWLENEL